MRGSNFRLINNGDGSIGVCEEKNESSFFSLKTKTWESDFFKRKFGTIQIDRVDHINSLSDKQVIESLVLLMEFADHDNYEIIEIHIDINNMRLISFLEETGFRLVDTRITFVTLIDKDENELKPSPVGIIEYAVPEDLEEIVNLTNESFIDNERFFSRFKDERYFTKDETKNYYRAWISNHIQDKDTYFIVMKDKGRIFAYFFYKRGGVFHGKALYKGILTAVAPEYRGSNLHLYMQSYLYKEFSEKEFFLDNTTQLTNIPTMKNHIKSQKQLNRIELTFFRTLNADFNKLLK